MYNVVTWGAAGGGSSGGGGGSGGSSKNSIDDLVKAVSKRLPNRNSQGKTAGYLVNSNGNIIGDMIISGRNQYSFDDTLIRGYKGSYTIQDHVEAQAAGIMRDNNIDDAILVLNNHPCADKMFTCENMLKHMLPVRSRLRVIVPDGFDVRGRYDRTFVGE